MNNQNTNNENLESVEVKSLNEEFVEFLHTKGIKAKFKLAFANMKESAKAQHEKDVAEFERIKKESAENNKEFVEFLHTKGFKAKVNLVIENIKKGARESKETTKAQIEKAKNLGKTSVYNPYANKSISKEDLSKEFNEFLKMKGLDQKYTVTIEDVE